MPPPTAPPLLLQTPADLHHARTLSQARLKQSWERIFTRFSHDFSGIADEIDGATGALLVDNGHLRSLADADADTGLDDDDDFSTDDDDDSMPQRCARCAERDELDDSPCRHHRTPEKTETVAGPTAAQILAWTPAQLHTHLAALSARIDTCDLSFQLQKHGIGGRAVGALALAELGTRLRLREPEVVAVVWAEVRRLQAILAGGEGAREEEVEAAGEGEDAWAPPPRALDPFYSAAWRDEHPDGTPAAFRGGKRRREEAAAAAAGVGGGGKKRVKVVRVGAPKDAAVGPTRSMMVGVAIPARTVAAARDTTPAASRKARKHAVQTPGPAPSATTSTSAGPSSATPAALKSILKKPRTPAPTTTAPPKATTTTTAKAPSTATTPAKPTRTPKSAARAQTRTKTPPSAAAAKTAPQTPPLPTPRPASKTPKTATKTPTQRQRQRPKGTPAKKTPRTAGHDTPGWTASVDRARLRGHSFLGFADGGGGGDGGEDELASPGAGQRGGGMVKGKGREREKEKEKEKEKAVHGGDGAAEVSAVETTLGVGGEGGKGGKGGSLHACSGRGFCFVCMDLEGEEDDLI